MIALYDKTTTGILGWFGNVALANKYLDDQGIADIENYLYLRSIDDMAYISRTATVDGNYIYNNKTFWQIDAQDVYANFENYTVLDYFGNEVDEYRFKIEKDQNSLRIGNVVSRSDEVAYNIKVGFEFISLFRESCIETDLGAIGMSGLAIAGKVANIIPLITTGSFNEARILLGALETDAYFTEEYIAHLINMLVSADIITYL